MRIGKGGNWFCYPEHLPTMMAETFSAISIDGVLASETPWDFAQGAAHLLSEINAGHPFREGNGRTQLAYLNLLVATAGYGFNAELLAPQRVINAMVASFGGDITPLTELIGDLIS